MQATRRLAAALAAGRSRSGPIALPRLARKPVQRGRADGRRHSVQPAARAHRRLLGDRLHGDGPRFAQVAHRLAARVLPQHAAAADHAAAVAAGDRSVAAQHHAADRGTDSAGHRERESAGRRREPSAKPQGGRIRHRRSAGGTCLPSTRRRGPRCRPVRRRAAPPKPKFDDCQARLLHGHGPSRRAVPGLDHTSAPPAKCCGCSKETR